MDDFAIIEDILNIVHSNITFNNSANKTLCSFCHHDEARLHCTDCDRDTCQQCDSTWHSDQTERATHSRTALSIITEANNHNDINRDFDDVYSCVVNGENGEKAASAVNGHARDEWKCSVCDFVNSDKIDVCAICEMCGEETTSETISSDTSIRDEALEIIELSKTLNSSFPSGDLLSASVVLALADKVPSTEVSAWAQDQFTQRLDELAEAMSARLGDTMGLQCRWAAFNHAEVTRALLEAGLEGAVERAVHNKKGQVDNLVTSLAGCDVTSEAVLHALANIGPIAVDIVKALQTNLAEEMRASLLAPRRNFRTRDHRIEHVAKVLVNQDLTFEARSRCALVELDLRKRKNSDRFVRLANIEEVQEANTSMFSIRSAVVDCSDDANAKAFLCRTCKLCYGTYSKDQMETISICSCELCNGCFKDWLTNCVREKRPTFWVCPACDVAVDFEHLQLLVAHRTELKHLSELFAEKLNQNCLSHDHNFVWCSFQACGNGFIAEGDLLKIQCSNCEQYTCKDCKKAWHDDHNKRTCEEFETYLLLNDPEITDALVGIGIDCPKCKHKYSLARGGCLHFTCKMCHFEFCSGCRQPFSHGSNCKRNFPRCAKLGLHAHHPRNCLSHMQDLSTEQLKNLLKGANQEYSRGSEGFTVCSIMVTKETGSGDKDERCGDEVVDLDMCRNHFKEYLVSRINQSQIDPITVYPTERLCLILASEKANNSAPKQNAGETAENFRQRVVQMLQNEYPIPKLQ